MQQRNATSENRYPGTELELFRYADNWKNYIRKLLAPYLHGDVLEVGAGIGATTKALRSRAQRSWTAVEPDAALASQLRDALATTGDGGELRVVEGTLQNLASEHTRYQAIIYIDVLEHIADDAAEVAAAAALLRAGGRLVVLCPAHMWLYSPFDRSIGHHRRYNLKQLQALGPRSCRVIDARYLDSVGVAASVANRFLLRSDMPSKQQLLTWDRLLVPASRLLDPLLRYRLGKSVLVVWQRDER
jgi:2-polyprenyl-3-methyl-5-hydroxy-6-metoxy-1,4-benzoquinol methylase